MTYPQPEDWPTDESRIEAIMQNGNCGAPYMLKSLVKGDKFTVNRTNKKYVVVSTGKTNAKVRNTKMKSLLMSNQTVVTKL